MNLEKINIEKYLEQVLNTTRPNIKGHYPDFEALKIQNVLTVSLERARDYVKSEKNPSFKGALDEVEAYLSTLSYTHTGLVMDQVEGVLLDAWSRSHVSIN